MDERQNLKHWFTLYLDKPYAVVLETITQGLKQAGFVVATEIDIKDTLKRKLNIDSLPYKVLRAYNPQLIAKAHALAPDTALLPYNISIAQLENGSVEVSIVDPLSLLTLDANPVLKPVVAEAHLALLNITGGLQ